MMHFRQAISAIAVQVALLGLLFGAPSVKSTGAAAGANIRQQAADPVVANASLDSVTGNIGGRVNRDGDVPEIPTNNDEELPVIVITTDEHPIVIQVIIPLGPFGCSLSQTPGGSIRHYWDDNRNELVLVAVPDEGYHVKYWGEYVNGGQSTDDLRIKVIGNPEAPLEYRVSTPDRHIICFFQKDNEFTVYRANSSMGDLQITSPSGNLFAPGTQVTIHATPSADRFTVTAIQMGRFAVDDDGSINLAILEWQTISTDADPSTGTFIMPECDVWVCARYDAEPIRVTGTVSPDYSGYLKALEVNKKTGYISLRALPDFGYYFKGWYVGDELVCPDYVLSTVVTETTHFVATNEALPEGKHWLYIDDEIEHGKLEIVSPKQFYDDDDTVHVIATPDEGYALDSIKVGAIAWGSFYYDFTYHFDDASDCAFPIYRGWEGNAVKAIFVPCYTVTARSNDTSFGSVTGEGQYNEGKTVTLTATPADGYRLVGWTIGGTQVGTDETYSFAATENCMVVAVFEKIPVYTVTASVNDEACGTVNGGGEFREGTQATFTATPNDGYRFVKWLVDGEETETASALSFTVSANTEVTAVFEAIPVYTVGITVNIEGSGTATGAGEYREGATVNLNATANEGYAFLYWEINGEIFNYHDSCSFTISEDYDIEAVFAPLYVLTINVYLEGELSESDRTSYCEGSDFTVMTPGKPGYRFLNWKREGEVVGEEPGYHLVIDQDIELNCYYEQILKVTTQPSDKTVTEGKTAKFTVAATVTETVTYRWQTMAPNSTSWKNSNSTSATKATFSIATKLAHNGYRFRCVVTDTENGTVAISEAATLTVNEYIAPPKITTQPKSLTVTEGETAKFTIAVTDTRTFTYQWQTKAPGSTTWKNSTSASAKKATFSIATKLAHNGYQFRCVVTNDGGVSVTSAAAALTVNAYVPAPTITKQPKSTTVTVGKTAKFTIAATAEGTVTYQWQIKSPSGTTWKNSTSASAKKATFSITTQMAHNGYQVRCIVTDAGNGGSTTSAAATLTVEEAGALITTQPKSTTVSAGTAAKFTVAATGNGTLTYQWQTMAPNGTTWKNSTSASAKKATFSITAQAAHNGYQVRCIVTDGDGKTTTSDAATLTVN